MLSLPPSVHIWLSVEPIDMRKSFDGLLAVVSHQWKKDPYTGHLFAFVGRRKDRIKILLWDHGGFVLLYKRLEKGRFQMPEVKEGQTTVTLEGAQLTMLLSGYDLNVSRLRKWTPPASH